MAAPANQIKSKLQVFAARSENPDHPSHLALDDDRESYWQPNYYVDAEPWIIFNLSYPSVIDEVIVDVRNSLSLGSTDLITIRVCAWEPSSPDNRNPQSQCDFRFLSPRWDLTESMHTWLSFNMHHFLTERIDVTAYDTPFEIFSVWAIQGTSPPIPTHAPVATRAPVPTHAPTSAKGPTQSPVEVILIEVDIPETDRNGVGMGIIAIIGISVASFFGGLLLCCGFCWLRKKKGGRYQFEYGAPELNASRKRSVAERAELLICPCFEKQRRRYSSQIAARAENEPYDMDEDSEYIKQLRVTQESDERKRVVYPDDDEPARGQAYSSSEGTVPARLIPPRGPDGRQTGSILPTVLEENVNEYRTLLPEDERIESEGGDEVYGTPDRLDTAGDVIDTVGEEGESLRRPGSTKHCAAENPEPLELLSAPVLDDQDNFRAVLPRARGEPTEEPQTNELRPEYTEDLTPGTSRTKAGTFSTMNSEIRRGLHEPLPPSSESSKSSGNRSEGLYPPRANRGISPVYEELEKSPGPPPLPQKFRKGRGLPKLNNESGERSGDLMQPGKLLQMARPTPRGEEVIDL